MQSARSKRQRQQADPGRRRRVSTYLNTPIFECEALDVLPRCQACQHHAGEHLHIKGRCLMCSCSRFRKVLN